MKIKRIILGLILLSTLVCTTSTAQEKDKVQVRVHYATLFHRFEGEKYGHEEKAILDIGKKISHFYGFNSVHRQLIQDRVLAQGGSVGDVMNACEREGYPRSKLAYQVWKNYPTTNRFTFTERVFKEFRYIDKMSKPKWTLVPQDSIVASYQCQKAEAYYLGRHWTVWFTSEIPYSDGPWLLYGLPGLILQAKESEGLFAFTCTQIEQIENESLFYPNRKYVECSRQEYRDLMKLNWKSPDAFIEKLTGFRGKGYDQQGNEIVYPERVTLFIDKVLDTE